MSLVNATFLVESKQACDHLVHFESSYYMNSHLVKESSGSLMDVSVLWFDASL